YFLFGEVYLSRKARATQITIFEQLHPIAEALMGCARTMEQRIAVQYQPVFSYAASINGLQTTDGNTAELMADGDATLTRMLADIDAASDQVHVLYYIWLTDHTGTALAEALIRAAGRGVTCRAMADGLGSRAMIASKLWQRMQA